MHLVQYRRGQRELQQTPPSIPEVVRDAAASDHKNLLILPGGFAEAGEEGKRRDVEVRDFAAEQGVSVDTAREHGLAEKAEEYRKTRA